MSPARSKRQPVPHRRSRADIVKAVGVGGRRSSWSTALLVWLLRPGPGRHPRDRRADEPPAARELARSASRSASAGARDLVDPARQPPDAQRRAKVAAPDRARASCSSPWSSAASLWPGGLLRHDVAPAPVPDRPRPRRPAAGRVAPRSRRDDGERPRRRRRPPTTGATSGHDRDRHDRRRRRHHAEPVTDNERLRARFVAEHPFPLDDFQRRALDALDAGRSVLVAAPTGAGKTLVAEYAIAAALEAGGKTFYTTPLKALSNQKYGDFVRLYGAANVGLLTGDNVDQRRGADRRDDDRGAAQHDLRRARRRSTGLRYAVLDEVHYLQDPPAARCGKR